jgi:hypothetical protein
MVTVPSDKRNLGGAVAASNVRVTNGGVTGRLPMFPGFSTNILPVLVAYWVVASGVAAAYSSGLPLVIAGWLSPTTIMLWPVGRKFGLKYTDYRTPWFLASVASMAGVPLCVFWIISTPMSDPFEKYLALVLLISVVIGLFGVETAHREAYGKPLRMFFRPDLILGSNRILAGGLAALAIGMKFMFSDAPPGDVPHGDWFAFFFIIVLGLYQLIPLRGLIKMRSTLTRMLHGGAGLGTTLLRELYLIAGVSLMLFSAHNFFGGAVPFTRNVLRGSELGAIDMVAAAIFVILLRSWYKRRVGDPFFKETVRQSLIKDLILVVGMSAYFYGFIAVMVGGFPRPLNLGANLYLSLIGLGLYLWGLILLIPLRAWARQNQKTGIMQQMMAVILPSLDSAEKNAAIRKILTGLLALTDSELAKAAKLMVSVLGKLPEEQRGSVMDAQMRVLAELPAEDRLRMMRAMDYAMMQH